MVWYRTLSVKGIHGSEKSTELLVVCGTIRPSDSKKTMTSSGRSVYVSPKLTDETNPGSKSLPKCGGEKCGVGAAIKME